MSSARWPAHSIAVVLLAVLFAACGSDAGSGEGETPDATADGATSDSGVSLDSGASDGDGSDAGEVEDAADADAGADATPDIPEGERLAFGEPCQEDAQCEGFLCLRIDAATDTGICSGFCFEQSDCPEEAWDCLFFTNSGSDAALVCVPDDLCIDGDDDGHGIGPGCQGPDCDDDLPSVNVSADETCDGIDNDCDGNIDDNPIDTNLECDTGFPGPCGQGRTFCQSGLLDCVGFVSPELEVCDLEDNDCDGEVDEGDDGGTLMAACYGGPAGTENVGACRAGARMCVDGVVSTCEGQVLPNIELCDGVDNDCDGEIDEGDPDAAVVCDTGLLGVCGQGQTVCTDEGVECVPRVEASPEVCDGFDNDCDGLIDENDDGSPLTRDCYFGDAETRDVGTCVGGEQTCSFGEWGGCVGQVLPSVEICDGADNNCDGAIDDGNPGGGIACSTGLSGRCAQGTSQCMMGAQVCVGDAEPAEFELCNGIDDNCNGAIDEGELWENLNTACVEGRGECAAFGVYRCDPDDPAGPTVCDALAGEPVDELCNGLDDDCDGAFDEDYPTLGDICVAGEGFCQAAGIVACDGATGVACNAEPREPASDFELACDFIDDDCDGEVDEDFQVDGRFVADTACGNCLTDCTTIFNRPNGFGVCDDTPETPTCVLACDPGFFDLNNVPDDGCEFGLDTAALYVSSSEGAASDEAGCGTGPSITGEGRFPCASIQFAIDQAGAGIERILVANGAYEEGVRLADGLDVLGGYRSDTWERNVAGTASALRAPSGAGDLKTVIAEGIASETVFEGFLVYGANAVTTGSNSYAIYARDSGAGLSIRNNVVFAGSGAPGARGGDGFSGENGESGSPGRDTFNTNCTVGSTQNPGGSGGAKTCDNPGDAGTTDVSGGTGGAGLCPERFQQEGSGTNGANSGGAGGAGGWGHDTPGSCFPTPGEPETGTEGGDGPAGTFRDGAGGSGCADTVGEVVGGEWRAASGLLGAHGAHGAGGGGGGAGSGQELSSSSYDIAGSGGGGGSGGCAAERGTPGSGGGGSFGIFVLFDASAPASAAQAPVVSGNAVNRSQGGNGGDGGNGGAGGDPGPGALGGQLDAFNGPSFCVFPGAPGGFGSRGGHGGGAGGGCGGASFDIVAWGTGGVSIDYGADNDFGLGAGVATGGSGGTGGNSSNTALGLGGSGAAGLFGTFVAVP